MILHYLVLFTSEQCIPQQVRALKDNSQERLVFFLRSRGNSLSRNAAGPSGSQEQQLGALFSRRPPPPSQPRSAAASEASLELTSVRTGSPRPTAFAEPLMPAALRPSKERSTPEVSKAIESGEKEAGGGQGSPAVNATAAGAATGGFRARTDASPLSTGTFRIPKGQTRVGPPPQPPDEEFQTPMEEKAASDAGQGDGRITFAQFLAQQRQQKVSRSIEASLLRGCSIFAVNSTLLSRTHERNLRQVDRALTSTNWRQKKH